MKIALINNQPPNTGIGRYSFTIYKHMEKYMNIDHFFIDRERKGIYKIVNDNDYILIKKNRWNLMPIEKLSNLSLDYLMGRYIPDNYDLYHITNQNMSNLNYYKNIGLNILSVHDIIYFCHPRNQMQKLLSKLLYKGLMNTEFIISISNTTEKDLTKHFNISPEKIRTIPLGVDNQFKPLKSHKFEEIYSKYGLNKNDTHILHVGKDSPRKNIVVLLKALKLLLTDKKMENIKLIKINEMDTELIKKMGLEDHITVLEDVFEEDLPKFYNMADVFVFPSIYEGFGLPLVEALACGTPVIASNVTSVPEIVEDAGILLDPGDHRGFSEKIYQVLTHEDLRLDMRQKGLKKAKKFNWAECGKNTIKVYKDLLNQNI